MKKSKLEEEGAILEEKLEAINEELENVENELERDENLTDTISTNLKEFVRSSEKALKGFTRLLFSIKNRSDLEEERLKVDQFVGKYCNALKSYQMFEVKSVDKQNQTLLRSSSRFSARNRVLEALQNQKATSSTLSQSSFCYFQ